MTKARLTIGIPKEIMEHEMRVAAIPATVKELSAAGARVLVESGAGTGAYFHDNAYKEAGAEIIADCMRLYAEADLVLKVKEPLFNTDQGRHEVDMMHTGQVLIGFLHPASPANHNMIRMLASQGVTALTLDSIPRITRAQPMDALTSMSTVAGYKATILAANTLTKFVPMVTSAVGTIQPARIFVIGAGVAGLQAIATAKRLGAVLYAADIRPEAAEQAKSLGAGIVDTGVPRELAMADGGYARPLPEEWLAKERTVLWATVSKSDILILAALVPGRISPVLVTEEMVATMAPGSVIVDIAIDQGGNCTLTEPGTTTVKHGITIIGTKNIPGYVSATSTWLFANNICNFVTYLFKGGRLFLDYNDEIIRSALVTIDGQVVHTGALEAMTGRGEAAHS